MHEIFDSEIKLRLGKQILFVYNYSYYEKYFCLMNLAGISLCDGTQHKIVIVEKKKNCNVYSNSLMLECPPVSFSLF